MCLNLTNVPVSGVVPVVDGVAKLTFTPRQPGIAYLQFLPFTGAVAPAPPNPGWTSSADFCAIVRALPFDNELERTTPDSELSWPLVYNQTLSVYNLIYPVMSLGPQFGRPECGGGDGRATQVAISLDSFKSTLYMPMTRELFRRKAQTFGTLR